MDLVIPWILCLASLIAGLCLSYLYESTALFLALLRTLIVGGGAGGGAGIRKVKICVYLVSHRMQVVKIINDI